MCASYVYKRRKLRNSIALLSKQNVAENPEMHGSSNSGLVSKSHLLAMQKDDADGRRRFLIASEDGFGSPACPSSNVNSPVPMPPDPQNHVTVLDSRVNGNMGLDSVSKPEATNGLPVGEEKVSAKTSVYNRRRFTLHHHSTPNESCSSSKSNLEQYSALMKIEEGDTGECSSSDIKVAERQDDFTSARDFCIHVLKTSGLLGGVWPIDDNVPLEILGGVEAKFCLPCKLCGLLGNPRNMLICDLCEEAFHLPCCQEKRPFRDYWYCQPCFRKKPRPLLDAATGKSFTTIGEEYKRRIFQQELGPILFMLKDTQPYASRVRIGKDFQAEVPEWSGPVTEDYDSFGEPSNLDPVECASVNGWNSTKLAKSSSIGNWIQCREVIYDGIDDSDDGVVCGKWRRAPLFVTQTDDWDCSCSVVWDPFHADCAVPQELETEEVLKHLKYVELLKARLNKKQKSG